MEEKNRKKILIVDDTPENIMILGSELSKFHDVIISTSGKDGLKKASTSPPDLLLLDILMPDVDGFEVCRRLKENDSTKNIPVFFISAGNQKDIAEKIESSGAAGYISKPFNMEDVKSKIKGYL